MIVTKEQIDSAKREIINTLVDIETRKRKENECVNLPLYGILWSDRLTYQEFVEKYQCKPLLSHEIPQCHICTRFEDADNPLFAYSYFQRGDDYKLIYRCVKGHGHDHGRVFIDIQTGLEVYCNEL